MTGSDFGKAASRKRKRITFRIPKLHALSCEIPIGTPLSARCRNETPLRRHCIHNKRHYRERGEEATVRQLLIDSCRLTIMVFSSPNANEAIYAVWGGVRWNALTAHTCKLSISAAAAQTHPTVCDGISRGQRCVASPSRTTFSQWKRRNLARFLWNKFE